MLGQRILNYVASVGLFTHLAAAFMIRTAFLAFGEVQDRISNLKYTDVDYYVFSDAANYVSEGQSPFLRHTYRYTPLFAYMLLPNAVLSNFFGKFLFVSFDVLTGYLIFLNCNATTYQQRLMCAAFWWCNPLTIAVSTRGNAESIMTTLVLLVLIFLKQQRLLLAGFFLGLAVHFKIYPIMYALPIYFSLHEYTTASSRRLSAELFMPSRKKLKFALASFSTFAGLTGLFYWLYGDVYLNEAFVYHVMRRDTRHNFSIYFYMLYLNCTSSNLLISIVTFLPQCILLVLLAFKFYRPPHLPFCLFCQTFVFVIFNKVCTSQYFLWYLGLLPLIAIDIKLSAKDVGKLLLLWFGGQGMWLLPAYFLEMRGHDTFMLIWLTGLIFFGVNVYIMKVMIKSYNLLDSKRDL